MLLERGEAEVLEAEVNQGVEKNDGRVRPQLLTLPQEGFSHARADASGCGRGRERSRGVIIQQSSAATASRGRRTHRWDCTLAGPGPTPWRTYCRWGRRKCSPCGTAPRGAKGREESHTDAEKTDSSQLCASRRPCIRCSSCLLDVEAEEQEAVGGVRPSVGPVHLRDEANEALAQLGRRAAQDVFVQRHSQS